jgi:cytosine/adenosine deaminase-related metal-dependent hydrolase
MSLVVDGSIAAMARGRERNVVSGTVWIGDDGLVEKVTTSGQRGPAGFDAAPRVDVGDAVVYPGLIDLHSHIGFNAQPLWVDPDRTAEGVPFEHHDQWPRAKTYPEQIPWPAWTLINGAPESTLAYIQVRALAGGTTAIQGWPGQSRSAANALVRSVDNEQVGPLADPVRCSTLTDTRELEKRVIDLREGRIFIRHCGEGIPSQTMRDEFEALRLAPDPALRAGVEPTGCVDQRLVVVHGCGLDREDYRLWRSIVAPRARDTTGAVVWSPFSNLWLYGRTLDVPMVQSERMGVCLGTDWGPSGTKNLLGELKVARLWADAQGWALDDHALVRMVTASPGDALARAWQVPAGRLVPGALGDLVAVAPRRADPWENLVAARERDVVLVAVGGRPRLGTAEAMLAAGAVGAVPVRMGNATRRVTLVRPDDPAQAWSWAEVLAGLEKVRASAKDVPPSGPAASRSRRPTGLVSGDPPGTPPMAVELDMPAGPVGTAGPPPKGRTVDIAPIGPVHHDPDWLASVRGRGFHGGVLDGLGGLFR